MLFCICYEKIKRNTVVYVVLHADFYTAHCTSEFCQREVVHVQSDFGRIYCIEIFLEFLTLTRSEWSYNQKLWTA